MTHPRPPAVRVKTGARDLGFSHAGIARVCDTGILEDRLRAWLDAGYHAGMQWMARDPGRRADPARVLPGAQSVIMVAMNYHTPLRHSDDPATGRISRYAWGDDYHEVLLDRLTRLAALLDELCPGSASRLHVDSGPVMEKAWAERAGLGWVGRNACLITRDLGSWVFLGTVITTAALDPDAAHGNFCGTCSACIDACPTRAIVRPGVVDARRCISQLTIESRDEDPSRGGLDFAGWVHGCDICQDVCPWNRFAQATGEDCFTARPHNVAPRLDALAAIDDGEFRTLHAGSPILRLKAERLRRNARIVLRQRESHS